MAVDQLSSTFAALADPTRREILARLAEGEATVNELADPFPISVQAVSKHLKVLERAGLIARGRSAQLRPSRLEAQALKEVADWVGDYAIPSSIVMCESGGSYSAVNPSSGAGGAYQILPSTWDLYGGEGAPHEAPKAEQDRIAAEIWADSGGSAWVCA